MGRYVHRNLQRLGADIVGELGEGDDGTGTMDEDFLSWKTKALEDLAIHMGVSRIEQGYKSSLEIKERIDWTSSTDGVFLGERNIAQQSNHGLTQPPYNYKSPYFASLSYTRHLFAPTCTRHCLHIEFDISGTDLSYQTGDHVGVWPVNSEPEIDRLLRMLDLAGRGDQVISLTSIDPNQSQSTMLPSPTTYASILRYHLEIQGRVSRELALTLAPMAPTPDSKALMAKLGSDKDYFKTFVTDRCLNLGLLLEVVSAGQAWPNIPFVLLLESLPPLQPRYYSISSSSSLHPTKIHLTAAVSPQSLTLSKALRQTTSWLCVLPATKT
jgi:NADPH-ferrihemoprotein reductase